MISWRPWNTSGTFADHVTPKNEGHSAPFEAGRRRYGMPDPAEDLDEPPLDERDLRGAGTPAFRRKRERFYEGH